MFNQIGSPLEKFSELIDNHVRVHHAPPKNLFHLFPEAIRVEILTYMDVQKSINSKSPLFQHTRANLRLLSPDVREVTRAAGLSKIHRPWNELRQMIDDSIGNSSFNAFKKTILRDKALISSLYITDQIVGLSTDRKPPQVVTASDLLDLVEPCQNLRQLHLSNNFESNLTHPFQPEDMARLASLAFRNLQILSLQALDVDISMLVSNRSFHHLTVLNLKGCSLTNQELSTLVNSPIASHLIELTVSACELVDDISTEFKTSLPLLQSIDFSETEISDISGFPQLKSGLILSALTNIIATDTLVTLAHLTSISFPPDIAVKLKR